MNFTKMHGLGNDYVLVDCFKQAVDDPPALAIAVSDRHTGIGSDGLILMHPSKSADVRMEIYNADGSRAQMCGNGLRCVAKYAREHGLVTDPVVRIDTDSGIKLAECQMADGVVRSVRVDMGPPVPGEPGAALVIGGVPYRVTRVSVGNLHAVVFVDDLTAVALEVVGPLFAHAPQFPEGVNTHFVRVDSPTHVTMKTWERGSGATRACGTGACAVCVAGALTKRTNRAITAALPGGDLQLHWAENDHVYMTGPAVEVFTGIWPN